jgi:hypothetical protein
MLVCMYVGLVHLGYPHGSRLKGQYHPENKFDNARLSEY